MHDLLFANPRGLDGIDVRAVGAKLGLEPEFSVCLAGAADEAINMDVEKGSAIGSSTTPLFVIGSMTADLQLKPVSVLVGAQSVSKFSAAIDELLRNTKDQDGLSRH
jgi:protein-disulfide isomerase